MKTDVNAFNVSYGLTIVSPKLNPKIMTCDKCVGGQ